MNEKITEKELLNNFSDIEKLIKEWDAIYTTPLFQESPKEEVTPIISEPIFIYEIHASI
jgi:hypothetical protein